MMHKKGFRSGSILVLVWTAFWVPGLFLFQSCNFGPNKNSDTPNQGTVIIGADNTIQPILEQELDIFSYDYVDTRIHCQFLPEQAVFHKLLHDSIRFAVVTRKLSPDERSHFENKKIEIYENKVASDAIAIIVNKENPDSNLLMSQIKDILSGKIQNWNQLNRAFLNQGIQVILDQNGSSIERTLLEKFGKGSLASRSIYSLNGNAAVADYVSKHVNALGFIGNNWLNNNDSLSSKLAAKTKLLALSDSLEKDGSRKYFHPYTSNIYTGKYPLIRSIYTLSVEGHTGLGTGFAVFLISDKGQLIFSKSGVLPARGASREIHLN